MASVESFLAPVAGPSPAGQDLRNDARFHAIERLLLPASRSARLRSPDSEPAVDWGAVLDEAEALAAEGRDLRLLAVVARAWAARDGFEGAARGFGLLADTVERHWEALHPELRDRPSPKEAAVRRINALLQIESDEDGVLCDLAFTRVIESRVLGRLTGGDLAAGGTSRHAFVTEGPQGLGESERAALLAAHEARVGRVRTAVRALAAEEAERLAALRAAVAAARGELTRLEDRLSARVAENGVGVQFAALGRFLDRVGVALAQAEPAAEAAPEGGAPAAVPAALAAAASAPGAIASRRDVERALDAIILFYETTEPASPIPLLARRIKRMVPMNFLQLMEEMAPGGLKDARNLAGVADEKK